MPVPTLGQRILEILKERGWRQAELARRVHIDKSHFSRMLRGERKWQPDQLERVAKAFEMLLADLVAGTEAEGLMYATRNAHEANKALTEQLAELAAANEMLRASLRAVEQERDTLRSERHQTQQELKQRPTKEAHRVLSDERDRYMGQVAQLQHNLAEARKQVTGSQVQILHLHGALKRSEAQVATNYQACVYWQQQAENNGAALKGVAIAAAGFGLVKLLSGDDDSL